MKFMIAVAALLAVATALPEVREKRGILSYAAPGLVQGSSAVISGPSGTIVADQVNNAGLVAAAAPVVAARSLYAPSVYSTYGAYGAPVVAAHAAYAAPAVVAHPTAYAAVAPGVTAGTVYAPGTTLVGPSTNGAPGAVITNSPFGSQILI